MTERIEVAYPGGYVSSMSREQALEQGLIAFEGDELTAEKARRIESSRRLAAEGAEMRQLRGFPVTVEALLKQLGWSAAYAEHRLHPACECWDEPDGGSPALCSWAEWLGFTSPLDTPALVTPVEVEAKAAAQLAGQIEATERWDGKPFRLRDLFPMSFVRLDPITFKGAGQ